jgi:biopolymer transport protein ExbD
MKIRRNLSILQGKIDLTPLVDVIFLLLIFFMLSRSFILQPGLRVQVPRSLLGQGIQTNHLMISIVMETDKRDIATGVVTPGKPLIFFNDEVTSMENLGKSLQKMGNSPSSASFVLKADQAVPHGSVVEIMNLILSKGYSVVLATQPASDAQVP